MLVLECYIEIEGKDNKKIQFTYVNNIEVSTSIGNLTDTAKVTLPRRVDLKGQRLNDFIGRGNRITIQTWYRGYEKRTIFKGYITSVTSETPMVIEAENEMWLLKQTKVKPKRYAHFSLKDFLAEYCPGIELVMPEGIEFGEVILKEEMTVVRVLDYLKQNYPFNAFFQDGKMVAVMMTSQLKEKKTVTFKKGFNTISDTLKYTLAEDIKIQIVAKSILANNKKLEAKSPKDNDAKECEVRTFYNPKCKTQESLKKYADDRLKTLKVDKMSGDITAFGEPFVRKGDRILFRDDINKERDNKVFVIEAVKYSFGIGGYRQTVTLGDEIKKDDYGK
jgi:hypothetical protein